MIGDEASKLGGRKINLKKRSRRYRRRRKRHSVPFQSSSHHRRSLDSGSILFQNLHDETNIGRVKFNVDHEDAVGESRSKNRVKSKLDHKRRLLSVAQVNHNRASKDHHEQHTDKKKQYKLVDEYRLINSLALDQSRAHHTQRDALSQKAHEALDQPNLTSKPLVSAGSGAPPISDQQRMRFLLVTICLPIVACLLLLLLFCYVWCYCKKLARIKREKLHLQHKSKVSTKIKSNLKEIKILGSDKKSHNDKHHLTINVDSDQEHGRVLEDNQLNSKFNPQSRQTNWKTNNPLQRLKNGVKQANESSNKNCSRSASYLKYSLSYDFNNLLLIVNILEARNLPSMDLCGASDPYVKVYLTSNRSVADRVRDNYDNNISQQQRALSSCCFKTRVHKRQLNPQFNESFQFQVSYDRLMEQKLCMHVFDYDRLSKNEEIGQVQVALDNPQLDLSKMTIIEQWAELQRLNPKNENKTELGDICLSLRYVPTAGRLTVVVLEARKLKKMDVAGLSDPYVKLVLVDENGKRLRKRKTSVKKCTLNPHYNESFSFEIPFEQMQKVQLHVIVIDYDRIGTSEPIGRIILGCDAADATSEGSTELSHWMDILASPRRPIAQWHTLKPLNELGGDSQNRKNSV